MRNLLKPLLWLVCPIVLWNVGVAIGADGISKTIVLIGGIKSHGPAEHDFPNGIRLLSKFLESSPDIQTLNAHVDSYPDGWPGDDAVLENAATIVWYFDGLEGHPMLDVRRRARFAQLMRKGVGLVALHQASTLPPEDKLVDLPQWLGAARYGMFDRTTEMVELKPTAHPISRGVGAFTYLDEFYPTVRFGAGREKIVPILAGTLHIQVQQGKPIVTKTEIRPVAWAFERPGGGRSFGFTGLHYLAGLDQPELRKLLLNAIVWTAGMEVPKAGVRSVMPDAATKIAREVEQAPRPADDDRSVGIDKLTYHYNPQRTGWNDREVVLTPKIVASPAFGLLWQSLPFDYFNGTPPRLFATPLYVHAVELSRGTHSGRTVPVLYVVTTAGFAYALNAAEAAGKLPGSVLWRKRLASKPCYEGTQGNLSTPVIDLSRHRLYVSSCDDDAQWQVHALDIRSGEEFPGWPVSIDHVALNAPGINRNGTRQWAEKNARTQRGALNLSPDASRLYLAFGPDPGGWVVSVDTHKAQVATAFSSTAVQEEEQGGMWASGGPSVDSDGDVYIATGANFGYTLEHRGIPAVFPDSAHSWGQSILQLRDDPVTGFELTGSYTPFNYCQTAANDIDLGSSGTVVIDLNPSTTSTPHLLALGGAKQGNVYLLDRAHMPGGVTKRHPCSTDSESDMSLLAPENQPQFGKRGPVNVFGPYTEEHAVLDQARSRTTLAYFHAASGESYVFVTGSSKNGADFSDSVPPGLARLKIVTSAQRPAYLRIDRLEQTQIFKNPGSPIVTSNGERNAIVWVLDTNAKRTASLYGANAPQPIIYAFDALSLELLWKSAPGVLQPGGKYNEPTVVNGIVFVGTDRIQAFGVRPPMSKAAQAAARQFKPLFDGKTLSHWRGDAALWSVKDGAITGESAKPIEKNTFLIHDGTYRNFELHFKYRLLTTDGNSGMQYRSRPDPEHGQFSVSGYQANVVPITAKERYSMLYEENGRAELALLGEKTDVAERGGKVGRRVLNLINQPERVLAAVRPYPEWNDDVIVAYDNHLVHAVNGMLAVDVMDNDFEGRASEGFLALQLHAGPPMGVQFKDIEIRELTAEPEFADRFSAHPAPAPVPQLTDAALAGAIKTGEKIYAERCAACHSVSQSGAPPKETLEQLPHQKIVDMLVTGAMQPQASGLGDAEINALAVYLTSFAKAR